MIPQQLKQLNRWILWKREDGRKVPYSVRGYRASTMKPSDWTDYESAANEYADNSTEYAGLGIVLGEGVCGVDLDGCRDKETGAIADWAKEIVDQCGSYWEVSPSETGVKIYCTGEVPKAYKRPRPDGQGAIELYGGGGRYFAVTGQGDAVPLAPIPASLLVVPASAASESPDTQPPEHYERAREFVLKMPDCVETQGSHNRIINVVAEITRWGLVGKWAVKLFQEYNKTKCFHADGVTPYPWEGDELKHKWKDGFNKAKNQIGQRLYEGLPSANVDEFGELPTDSAPEILLDDASDGLCIRRNVEKQKPFPLDSLPSQFRGFIEQNAKSIGCDVSFLIPFYVTSAALCVGRRRWVHLKNTWQEPLIFWIASLATQGGGKTPAYLAGAAALKKIHNDIFANYKAEFAAYAALAEQHKSKSKLNPGTCGVELPPLGDKPKPPERTLIHTCTTEQRIRLHARNPNGLAIISDELSGVIKSLNEYKGGRGSDKEKMLSSWSGTSEIVDRVSDGNELPEYAEYTGLQMGGGTQPDVWRDLMYAEQNDINGFGVRWLPMYPENRVSRWVEDDVNEEFLAEQVAYLNVLRDLPLTLDDNLRQPIGVGMKWADYRTKNLWVEWHDATKEKAQELQSDDHVLAGAYFKLVSYCARYAGLIELLSFVEGGGSDDTISFASMKAAITIVEWHKEEWERCLSALAESTDGRVRRLTLELIAKKYNGKITPTQLMHSMSIHREAGKAEIILSQLAAIGFGMFSPPATGPAGGRPVRTFTMLPRFLDQLVKPNAAESTGGNAP